MSQNSSLSASARLLCYLGPPSTILLTSVASPRTALISPVAFLPTAWLYQRWRQSNNINPARRGDLESMVWTYAATSTLGLAAVMLCQLGICTAASYALFGSGKPRTDFLEELFRGTVDGLTADQVAHRADLAGSWQNWVFNGIFTFGVAGLVEETLKCLPIAYARRRRHQREGAVPQGQQRNRVYIDYALAGALGFGMVETIGFLYAACEAGYETGPRLALTVFERMVGSVGHLLVTSLTALRATRRDFYGDSLSWCEVTGPAVLFHGAFNFVAIAASTLEGNVGWIHPTDVRITTTMIGLATSLVLTTAWWVKREWQALDERDQRSK